MFLSKFIHIVLEVVIVSFVCWFQNNILIIFLYDCNRYYFLSVRDFIGRVESLNKKSREVEVGIVGNNSLGVDKALYTWKFGLNFSGIWENPTKLNFDFCLS